MKNLFYLSLFVIIIFPVFSQEIDLIAEELNLEQLLLDLRSAKNNQEKQEKNALLKSEMTRVLQSKDAMFYPFLKLKTIGFIDSPDKQMRIVNWNVEQDDFSQNYTAFIIHFDKRKQIQYVTELEDKTLDLTIQPYGVINADNWYGALYYKIIPVKKGGKIIYTVLGWDYNNSLSQIKIIDAIHFTGKTVKLGSPIFKYGNKTKKRIFFEHSKKATMSLKYEEDRGRIIFDHLSPESPNLKNFRSFYVPDMSYDGFVFERGKWVLHEDIIGVNKSTAIKQYIYVKNNKTGKIERKKIKSVWLNPEDSETRLNGNSHVATTPDLDAEKKGTKKNNGLLKSSKKEKKILSYINIYSLKRKKKIRRKWKRN